MWGAAGLKSKSEPKNEFILTSELRSLGSFRGAWDAAPAAEMETECCLIGPLNQLLNLSVIKRHYRVCFLPLENN